MKIFHKFLGLCATLLIIVSVLSTAAFASEIQLQQTFACSQGDIEHTHCDLSPFVYIKRGATCPECNSTDSHTYQYEYILTGQVKGNHYGDSATPHYVAYLQRWKECSNCHGLYDPVITQTGYYCSRCGGYVFN